MPNVIDRESAKEEVRGWFRHFGEPVDADVEEMIDNSVCLRASMQGRIMFDDDSEVFVYSLIKPISKENGESIETVTVQEPSAEWRFQKQTMRVKSQGSGGVGEVDINNAGLLMSAATGLSVNMLRRLKNRDYKVIDELCGFFD
ncbi:MAG: phage tail assembly protein [Spirochaetota bacterium]